MNKIKIIFVIFILTIICNNLLVSNGYIKEKKINIFELLKKKTKFYKVNIHNEDKYSIQFYGNNKNFNSLISSNSAVSTHNIQMIYYKNITNKKNLYSIIFLASYEGNPRKEFSFSVEDLNNNVLYKSKKIKYGDFLNKKYTFKEYIVDIKNIPNEFFIKFYSKYEDNNKFYIMVIESTKCYSFNYINPTKYEYNYKNRNFGIFVKFY